MFLLQSFSMSLGFFRLANWITPLSRFIFAETVLFTTSFDRNSSVSCDRKARELHLKQDPGQLQQIVTRVLVIVRVWTLMMAG